MTTLLKYLLMALLAVLLAPALVLPIIGTVPLLAAEAIAGTTRQVLYKW